MNASSPRPLDNLIWVVDWFEFGEDAGCVVGSQQLEAALITAAVDDAISVR